MYGADRKGHDHRYDIDSPKAMADFFLGGGEHRQQCLPMESSLQSSSTRAYELDG